MLPVKSLDRSRLLDSVENLIIAYESHQASNDSSLEEFWRLHGSSQDDSALIALIKYDLDRRFTQGERPRVVEYLDRFPDLRRTSSQVVSLVYEEFCLLREAGEDPDSDEFCHAYTPWRDSLRSQIEYHRDFSQVVQSQEKPRFPAAGDRFDRYDLIQVLGTGAAAKVYLASEGKLAGRKLVIKISASLGQEPTILARLKHRNIVPIYTFIQAEKGLCGICMPYRAGLTLEELIRRLGQGPLPQRSSVVRDILKAAESQSATPLDSRRPGWDGFPVNRSFPDAVAWVGLCLADALAYVHSQGILHRDIKPANILVTHEDGPQLLDFNLSREPESPQSAFASINGGTLPYMAPEQLQAFLDLSAWSDVGAAADLFSLGLVLRELATGQPPELPDPTLPSRKAIHGLLRRRARPISSAREINPLIPPSLNSIFEKSLAFDKKNRYQSAADLSQDLKRYLDRKPLVFARNSSKAERSANWIHRNRILVNSLLAVFLLFLGSILLSDPKTVPERADFLKARQQIESADLDQIEKARETFVRLGLSFPGSAWPLVYSGLALDKLNRKSPKPDPAKAVEITRLIKEASEKSDAEEAFRSAMEIDPESITLGTNYALVLLKPSPQDNLLEHKAQREEQARTILNRALKADPTSILVLNALIKLERSSRNFEKTLDLTRQAIVRANQQAYPPLKIYAYYNIQISCVSKLADRAIDQGRTAAERRRAVGYLDQIELILDAMTRSIQQSQPGKGIENHPYLVQIYRGCIASASAILAADEGDFTRASSLFGQAEGHFEHARSISSQTVRGDSYLVPVKEHLDLLRSRRERVNRQAEQTRKAGS